MRKGIDYLKELKPNTSKTKNHITYGSPDYLENLEDLNTYKKLIKQFGKDLSDAKQQELKILYDIDFKNFNLKKGIQEVLDFMEDTVEKNVEDENIKTAETNIMNRINSIDKCYMEAAPEQTVQW